MARGAVDLSKLPRGGMPPSMPEPEIQWQVTQQEVYPTANFGFQKQERGVLITFDIVTGLGAIKKIVIPFERLPFAKFISDGSAVLASSEEEELEPAKEVTDGETGTAGGAGGEIG